MPEQYLRTSAADLSERIERRRQQLGGELLILAHHYQRDEIVQHADFVGDSLGLSRRAAAASRQRGVRWIVFCGVSFMAETADILTDDQVAVILPNLTATCPMAAMASEDDVSVALDLLRSIRNKQLRSLVPIAYVNSSAAVKALVGKHGGACCTSANAQAVMQWALAGGEGGERPGNAARVLFLPDEHLGRNVCRTLGIPEAEQALWDPAKEHRGPAPDRIRTARVIHWKGYCYVHKRFSARDVAAARTASQVDGTHVRIVVHPECTGEVVAGADVATSTEKMASFIEDATPGSRWVLGTEAHLVNRLARKAATRGVEVRMLGRSSIMCGAMLRIAPVDLLWVLDHLAAGEVINRISVEPAARAAARLALDRMLRISI